MECAYIENLHVAGIKQHDPQLQELMAFNALKNINHNDAMVVKKIKLPHVRRIVYKWLQMSRASILHKEKLNKPRH